MAFADTMKIVPRDLHGSFYAGKSLRKSDVLTVDSTIKQIVFRDPVDIKALYFASGTEVVLMRASKITHIMATGRLLTLDNLFCGSVEAGGDLIIKGDLNTWLGDAETVQGNICVSGDFTCAGRILAKLGAVIVNGEVEAEFVPEAKVFWEGVSKTPLPDAARPAAAEAGRALKRFL